MMLSAAPATNPCCVELMLSETMLSDTHLTSTVIANMQHFTCCVSVLSHEDELQVARVNKGDRDLQLLGAT